MVRSEGDPVYLAVPAPVLVAPLHPPPPGRHPAPLRPGHAGVRGEPEAVRPVSPPPFH